MLKRVVYILLFSSLIYSCKSTKVSDGTVKDLSTKRIVKNHYKNEFDKKTINARIKTTYIGENNSQTITIKLRLEKDSVIWMSGTMLGFPLAKIMITPNRVQFYEKLNKSYFDGDFKLLSDFLGVEIDFNDVQNLLIGQSLLDLKEGRYLSEIEEQTYFLTPAQQEKLFDIFFWLNPKSFKIAKQEIHSKESSKQLIIAYESYQQIEDEDFPKKIIVTAIDGNDRTFLNLEYRSVEFDKVLSFPFSIPSGYEEIELNE